MLVDSRVQKNWLQLLTRTDCPNGVGVEKVEDGHYLVVVDARRYSSSQPLPQMTDYGALKPLIPNLPRTRAVYLNSSRAYHLSGIEGFRDWAGTLAEKVESGACHAFAVVDPQVLQERVRTHLQASGFEVERVKQGLRVSNGRFSENLNLLRAIVRMVLSRSNIGEAADEINEGLRRQFVIHDELFRRFQHRFERFQPAVMDHFFVAYPEGSCVAAGWDYWQVSGRESEDAARIFEQAMQEFETFLAGSLEPWLPGSLLESCEVKPIQN